MGILIGVSALILNEKNEVLLTKRHDLQIWVFPGGGINVAREESPEQAIKREVKEETGIKIKINRLAAVYLTDHPLRRGLNLFFLARKIAGKLKEQKGEVLEARWIKKENLDKFLSPRHYQRFLDAVSGKEIILRVDRRFPLPLSKLPLFLWRRFLGKKLGLVKD